MRHKASFVKVQPLRHKRALILECYQKDRPQTKQKSTADLTPHFKSMKPASKSNLPEIQNYMNGIINMYQLISDFFMQNNEKKNSEKALAIVGNIKNIQKNN